MGALALFLCGIVTHHVATTTFAFAHDYFLDAQVVRHLLVTTSTLEDRVGQLITTAHRHTQDVFPPALAELLEVILGYHARIAHKHTTAQFPPAQWTRPHHCGHMWELAVPHLPSRMTDFKGLARDRFYTSTWSFFQGGLYFQMFMNARKV